MTAEAREDGILIRPAVIVPVEKYGPSTKQNSFFPQRQLSRITAEHEKQLRNLASIRIRFRTDGRIDGPIVLLGKLNPQQLV